VVITLESRIEAEDHGRQGAKGNYDALRRAAKERANSTILTARVLNGPGALSRLSPGGGDWLRCHERDSSGDTRELGRISPSAVAQASVLTN
jgi:hypothetical protein